MTKSFSVCLLIVSAVMSFSALAQSWGGGDRAAKVLIEPVVFSYQQANIEAVGTAEAVRSVVLFPAVADEVTAVHFVPGQKVSQGDVLVELDARQQRVALDRANIQLVDAKRNVQRLLDSQQQGAVAEKDLNDAQTLRDLAEVSVREAQVALEDRFIVAPFSGVVGLVDVEIGDRVSLQTPITTIDAREALYINFSAPESAVDVLNSDPEVTLQPWSDRTLSLPAQIAQVDSRINEQDRTIRARALLDNQDDRFRPGMSFRVNLTMRGDRFATIPEAALSWGASGAYVWKAKDDKAVRVPVDIKQRLRGHILVEGELAEGEWLIAEGIQSLRDGQKIAATPRGAGLDTQQELSMP